MKILLVLATTFALGVMIVAVGFSGVVGGLLWLLPGAEGGALNPIEALRCE